MTLKRQERLILFTRYPVAGRAKTRLIPALGAEGAAALQRRLTSRAFRTALALQNERGVEVEIRFDDGSEEDMRHWLGDGPIYRHQRDGDLGARMAETFARSFDEGSKATVIIGADCPGLTPTLLAEAFDRLASTHAVFGPATDGGYYLIGLKRNMPELFRGLNWGTNSVLPDSLNILAKANVASHLLSPLDDIDRPEDLVHWERIEADDGDRCSASRPSLRQRSADLRPAAASPATEPLDHAQHPSEHGRCGSESRAPEEPSRSAPTCDNVDGLQVRATNRSSGSRSLHSTLPANQHPASDSLSPRGTSGERVGERGFFREYLLSPALSSTLGRGEGDGALPSVQSFDARISVVIPALNEVENIAATIASARQCAPHEIIVVDGCSQDDTMKIARDEGAHTIPSAPGRARQMNAGAARATGDILLFLHADTHLPANWTEPVLKAMAQKRVAAGAFRFQIRGDFRGKLVTEVTTNWRSHWLKSPYGDQALFLRRSLFEELGGYADMPIMEDFELVRRLRRHGRIVTLHEATTTSGRRWEKRGFLKTTLINHAVVHGYRLGVSLDTLLRLYRGSANRS